MVTTTADSQLGMFEHPLADDHLLTLLEDLETAKAQLEDAKGYLADYYEQLDLVDGVYRAGKWRVVVQTKKTVKATVKKAR